MKAKLVNENITNILKGKSIDNFLEHLMDGWNLGIKRRLVLRIYGEDYDKILKDFLKYGASPKDVFNDAIKIHSMESFGGNSSFERSLEEMIMNNKEKITSKMIKELDDEWTEYENRWG